MHIRTERVFVPVQFNSPKTGLFSILKVAHTTSLFCYLLDLSWKSWKNGEFVCCAEEEKFEVSRGCYSFRLVHCWWQNGPGLPYPKTKDNNFGLNQVHKMPSHRFIKQTLKCWLAFVNIEPTRPNWVIIAKFSLYGYSKGQMATVG